ncbi:MAG TPA: phosphoesterase [Planctomycetaceae bacterium]|nr:phosphoesterase [Planctomycetaceae bacterium]HRF02376.1 DHH family phosphoesterase [Pirellulaceae bacterium]
MPVIDWSAFGSIVRSADSFLLTSHIRPDCDALGSELGMAAVLEGLGKRVRIVNGQATPDNLAFIDPTKRIEALGETLSVEQVLADDPQVLIVLDTSAWAQLGPMGDVIRGTKARKLIVDHHVSEDDLGAELFKDTTAEACGVLVVEASDALGVTLDKLAATALFAAVATDTGWFRFGSTRPRTYEVAARLLRDGAEPAAIYRDLYEQDTLGRMRLRGRVLGRIETDLDGRLAWTHILASDFAETGAVPSDTEDLVNLLLAIRGTAAAVIFVEQQTGGFKLSFRSRCELDCSEVSGVFGGGGHRAAAGAFLKGTLDEVRTSALHAVRQRMRATRD